MVHEGVVPVRAFPLAAPAEDVSLVGTERELLEDKPTTKCKGVPKSCVKQSVRFEHILQAAMLAMDEGASIVGELGIGLNEGIDRFSGSILYDEKIGGTAHVAVGSGYPETGGTNKSALHWDFIIDMRQGGRIYVDDKVLCNNGQWAID